MPIARKLVVLLLLGLLLLIGAPAASATASSRSYHYSTHEAVGFTLTSACASIHHDVTGTGQIVHKVSVTTYPNGRVKQTIDDAFAQGSATDTAGHTYHFVYINRTTSNVPRSGSPIHVTMSDVFRLRSHNGGDQMNVSFLWRWQYAPQSNDVPTSESPGSWPPNDHWVRIHTQGDPLNCDPI